jgi:hypothetical protein
MHLEVNRPSVALLRRRELVAAQTWLEVLGSPGAMLSRPSFNCPATLTCNPDNSLERICAFTIRMVVFSKRIVAL